MKTLHGIKKIISGAQTGADRAAFDVAMKNGLEIGGYVPLGRMAEDGRIPEQYGDLIETQTEDPKVRTELNVLSSDATIIFSHGELTGGSLLTKQFAERHEKPVVHIDLSKDLFKNLEKVRRFLESTGHSVINVAGPRLSEDTQIYMAVKNFLELLFSGQNKERGS